MSDLRSAQSNVVTGTSGTIAAGSTQLTSTSVRLTQGVWVTPITEGKIYTVGVDSAAADSDMLLDCILSAENTAGQRATLFIPVDDPSRVYVTAVGGGGKVGYMYA